MHISEIKNIPKKIEYYSDRYNVSKHVTTTVINCESSFNPLALGDGGYSRGLVQIHSRYHPSITDEMAYDPDFAIKFLTSNLSKGKGHMWTCYRNNFS
jgi:soluble lytic murein transglycosylase-like protein